MKYLRVCRLMRNARITGFAYYPGAGQFEPTYLVESYRIRFALSDRPPGETMDDPDFLEWGIDHARS